MFNEKTAQCVVLLCFVSNCEQRKGITLSLIFYVISLMRTSSFVQNVHGFYLKSK